MPTWFVTGIDTGAGKTIATGLLARHLARRGESTVTMKLASTGMDGFPEDLAFHRTIMGTGLLPEDRDGITCPYNFPMPASPHLAARVEGVRIALGKIADSARTLAERYENVLVEGVGGWLVPLNERETTADFVAARGWPVILVSSPRLGSINHTLLTLQAMASAGLSVSGIVYNMAEESHPVITADTREVIGDALEKFGWPRVVVDMPFIGRLSEPPDLDFSGLLK